MCLLRGPQQPLLLQPGANPARGGSLPLSEPTLLSGPLSGLSLQHPNCWVAGLPSWLPSVCLLPSHSLTLPACPGLPAACPLPACLQHVQSHLHAGCWKEPNPAWPTVPSKSHQSYRGCASRNPSSAGHRPSWDPVPATVPVGLSCASQAGRLTDEPAGQRVAFPYYGTEHGVGEPCLPMGVCLTLLAKFIAAHRTRAQADPGWQS